MADKTLRFGLFAKDNASQAFDKVAAASEHAGGKMREGHAAAGEFGKGLDAASEAGDRLDTRAMGFRDTLTGVQDTMKGTSQIAKGNLFQGFLTLGMGIGDLGSGITNFLVPALGKFHVGAKLAAVGQRLLNLAMAANPIGMIVVGLLALGAGLYLAWKHSETFRNIVQGAFRAVGGAADWVKGRLDAMVGFITGMPGRIRRAASGMWDGIKEAFRASINWVIDRWNGLQFSIPGFTLPFPPHTHFGGLTIGVPDIPHLAAGGVVTRPTLALIGEAGPEAVVPLDRAGAGQPLEVNVYLDGENIYQSLLRVKRGRGGAALGLA